MKASLLVTLVTFMLITTNATQLKSPTFDRLPAGAIKPEGWLLRQAHIQAAGLTGGLATWAGGGVQASKWMPGPFTGGEEQGGEYYINGMYPLTCQIDAPDLRQIRERSVDKILRHVGPNGTLGGEIPDTAISNGKIDYWGRMIAVLALQTYVECTGAFAPNATKQSAVEAALLRHYKTMHDQIAAQRPSFWTDAWGSARYSEILLGVQWMIDRGHTDTFLFDLMQLVRGKSEEILGWEQWFVSGNPFEDTTVDTARCWPNKSDIAERAFQKHHGVNIMEAMKTGPLWYRVSGDDFSRNNTATALDWVDKYARSPDGTFTAPDCLNIPESEAHAPSSGVETCSVVESMFSLRTAYEITGTVAIYDRLERIAFNAMPATTDQLFGGNAYYHSVNQVHLNGKDGFEINGCCTGNVHQGWPKFIMSQVQTIHGSDSSIVLSGYSPFNATLKDGTTVAVGGQYPFADQVTIAVTRTANSAWSLSLRIPCWAKSAQLYVDGVRDPLQATPCTLFIVPGLEASSTSFTAKLAFKSSIEVLSNKWNEQGKGAVEIHRGPLVFTFPIPGIVSTTVLNSTSFGMVHQTSVALDSTKTYRIALQDPDTTLTFGGFANVSEIPFDRAHPAATIKAKARAAIDANGQYAKGHIPNSPVPLSSCGDAVLDVELVPIAHSYLRFTVLPVVAGTLTL